MPVQVVQRDAIRRHWTDVHYYCSKKEHLAKMKKFAAHNPFECKNNTSCPECGSDAVGRSYPFVLDLMTGQESNRDFRWWFIECLDCDYKEDFPEVDNE